MIQTLRKIYGTMVLGAIFLLPLAFIVYFTIQAYALVHSQVGPLLIQLGIDSVLGRFTVMIAVLVLMAIPSLSVIPPTFSHDSVPNKDTMLMIARMTGAEAILTVFLLDTKSETRYVSGSYNYTPNYGHYNAYGWYGFGGYYGY